MPNAIPHRIEQTRNRHSRAVFRDGAIVIRLARGLSLAEQTEHIEYLLRRMTRKVLKDQERAMIDPFRPILDGESGVTIRLSDGTAYRFTLSPALRTRARRTPEGWHVEIGPGTRRRPLHRLLWNLLAELAKEAVTSRVHRINAESFRERLGRVRLSYASSQWGSCSAGGKIHLNPVLLFLPIPLLEYVIIHELAHCRHRNHSDRYWRHVASVLPDFRERRAALRNVRICPL